MDKNVGIADRSKAFAIRIIKACSFLDEKPGICRTLSKQLLRSGTSVGANIRESRSAQSDKDFLHKMEIALKEARKQVGGRKSEVGSKGRAHLDFKFPILIVSNFRLPNSYFRLQLNTGWKF